MIVVNFFGGPGCGKSTTAAWLFSELKKRQISCEYVTEFAKDLTWEKNYDALLLQEYVFGTQSYRMARVKDKVDVLITDSPLPLSIIYNDGRLHEPEFSALVWQVFDEYTNVNFYLNRSSEYETAGRKESLTQAIEIDDKIIDFWREGKIDLSFFDVDAENTREDILQTVLIKNEWNKRYGN